MGLLLTFFFISIFFSFLCSILEAVLLSVTPAYVGMKEQEGESIATDLRRFKEDIDEPLGAILTLNTIAHTVGAIGVGAQAAQLFGANYIVMFGVTIISWEAMIAGLMTLAILIFSEVIPKTMGANNWELLAPYAVYVLKAMLFVLAPLVWLTQFTTRHLKKDKDRPVLSRADFAIMTDLGKEAGALDESERNIIHNLLAFRQVQVSDVMTPRIVVVSASESTGMREFIEEHPDSPFSRIPVYKEKNDHITGYVLEDEMLRKLVDAEEDIPLGTIRRDIIVVPKSMAIPALLDLFIEKKEHMALVVDEFGGMEGVVTMEDLIETLLGLQIVDESDSDEDMKSLARKNWERRARRMGIVPPVAGQQSEPAEKA